MAIPVLIIGKSGSGKSHSLKNLPQTDYALINILGKPLPFKNDKPFLKTFNYKEIQQKMLGYVNAGVKNIIIDDAGYLLTHALMSAGAERTKGSNIFNHYREMAENFYNLITFVQAELPSDVIVTITMHEERNDFGEVKPKTVGKMLDEKVSIEGLFTIVLNSVKDSEGYAFLTNTDGLSVTKSPEDMFEQRIPNDLNFVIEKIREYYNLGGNNNE
ncbi:MAG: AAA family ATPase [Clostridiales bacterium]|nr:AAA family ATPase [Clostridiales bacterium]